MKIKKNKTNLHRSWSVFLALSLGILAFWATGCGLQPPDTASPPDEPPLPSLTPLRPEPTPTPLPSPVIIPTLELIDSGLMYTVVGLLKEESLPLYQEPSLTAAISGQIPFGGSGIRTTGVEILEDDISWLQVDYQGLAGWVDLSYLAYQKGDIPGQLIELSQQVAAALKNANYNSLEGFLDPDLCLRFSPYPYIHSNALTLCPDQFTELISSNTVFTWGQFDGTGEPIELTFQEYHQRFVYDQDYLQPQVVGFNQEVSSGNAINNIATVFPSGIFVEYHFPGFDPQYSGMDWRSLRMVFMQKDGIWYLVALVHGEWTI